MPYTNIHGQEPSPPLPPVVGERPLAPRVTFIDPMTKKEKTVTVKRHQLIVQRVGREPIDTTRCQAPTMLAPNRHTRLRCTAPATCVIVENKPRPGGAIGGMALCARCYDMVLRTQGKDYAKMTPLAP